MQGVRSSSLLGSIFRKIQFSTGISAVFTGRFFSAKRLTVIFCAPKCAPSATNLSAWLKLIRSGAEKLAGTTAELVDVQLLISDFLLLWHTSASQYYSRLPAVVTVFDAATTYVLEANLHKQSLPSVNSWP